MSLTIGCQHAKIQPSQIAITNFIFYCDENLEILGSSRGASYLTRNGMLVPIVQPAASGLTVSDVQTLISMAENDRTLVKPDAGGYSVAPTAGQYPNADSGDVMRFIFTPSGREETWTHDGTSWSLEVSTRQVRQLPAKRRTN